MEMVFLLNWHIRIYQAVCSSFVLEQKLIMGQFTDIISGNFQGNRHKLSNTSGVLLIIGVTR